MHPTQIDLHELLPQHEPFVMVDRLLSFHQDRVVTSTVVSPHNLFVHSGVFTSAGLAENMAQSCAVRIGYINKYILDHGIRVGYIGAIRNLRVYRHPTVGQEIHTTIDVLQEVFDLTLVRATIHVGDELIAEAEMKIAQSSEPME